MILSCANNGHFLFPVAKMCLSVGLFHLFCLEFGRTQGEILNSIASWNSFLLLIGVCVCVLLLLLSSVFIPSLLLVNWQVWVSVFCLPWRIVFIYQFCSIFQRCFCCCFAGLIFFLLYTCPRGWPSLGCTWTGVTIPLSLLGTVLVYDCCLLTVVLAVPLRSRNCPSMDNTLKSHCPLNFQSCGGW